MDRNSIIGLVLITVLIFVWLFYMSFQEVPIPKEDPYQDEQEQVVQSKDSIGADSAVPAQVDSVVVAGKYGIFSQFAEGHETIYTVESEFFRARITSKGAAIKFWTLKEHKKWDKEPVQLINNDKGELFLNFITLDAKRIDTRNLNFKLVNQNGSNEIKLESGQSASLDFELDLGDGRKIVKTMKFYADQYHIDKSITIENLDDILPSRGYNLVWEKGLIFQEYNSVDEASDALAMVQMNGEKEEINADTDHGAEKSFTGIVDYAAIKTKYFGTAIIPQTWQSFDGTVDLAGSKKHHKNEGITETYSMNFRIPYKGGKQTNDFKVFIGPLDYDIVKTYGLHSMVNLGWSIIRPIGEYFMLPIFRFIHQYVPNYGVAILIFAFIIKILLHPLSITQMKSAQKMQLLQPEMEKMREKYKDDQQQQQRETMKLYSEYGINPAGGCLPLILQMPILFSLWAVLRSAIELRQAPFALWITDLSVPDKILSFGFSFMGISHLSGLALLMGITMFIQQKMTITDPRQKALVYMMPVMFTFLFANFPSGLNLYYFFFNLLAISQQFYINKLSKNKPTLADLKRMPKKEGWFQKKMREAQEMAEAKGHSIPGQKNLPKPSGTNQNRPGPQKKKKK